MSKLDNKQWPVREKRAESSQGGKKHWSFAGRHTSFVSRGYVMAKELCFHGVNRPIPPDESRITSLALGSPGRVFGATSGERCHLFAYFRLPSEDVISDMGIVPGAKEIRGSLVAWDAQTLFLGTAPAPGRVVKCSVSTGWSDCIQEWYHAPAKFEDVSTPIADEGIAALVGDKQQGVVYGLTDSTGTLFKFDVESGKTEILGAVDEHGQFSKKLLLAGNGSVYGAGAFGQLVAHHPYLTGGIERIDAAIPANAGKAIYARVGSWAEDPVTGMIYGGTETDGLLFSFDPDSDTIRSYGRPTLEARISAIAVGADGLVYGISGEAGSLGHMFMFEPETGCITDLGIPLATTEIRRYGYEFEAAITGPDGEIYLGETDRGGCLFMYFPPIPRREKLDDMPF